MKTGDRVTIRYPGAMFPIVGVVQLASPNGRSLMLAFEGILDGHVGQLPLLAGEDGVYRSIITNTPVDISPRSR